MLLKTRTLHFVLPLIRRQQEEGFFLHLPYYKSFGKESLIISYSWHNIAPEIKDERTGDGAAEYLKTF